MDVFNFADGMLRKSLILQLAILAAVAAAVSGGLSFIYSEAIPYLHSEFPSIRRVHDERPYVINGVLSLVSLILSFFAFFHFSAFKRAVNVGFGAPGVLGNVIGHSTLSDGEGVIYLNAESRILAVSQLTAQLAGASKHEDVIGKLLSDVYPSRLASLILTLQRTAESTHRPAAHEVTDGKTLGDLSLGPILVVVTPVYDDSALLGYAITFRSTKELKLTQSSAVMHQQNYQALFDNLQMGVAIFRAAVASDGGPDGYMLEANPAFKRLFDGLPLPYTEPASAVWPSFFSQDQLRDRLTQLLDGKTQSARCDVFSPALGKNLDVALALMPDRRILFMVSDQTEARLHEQQVQALNERLQRNLSRQNDYMTRVLSDASHFHEAASDLASAELENLMREAGKLPEPCNETISRACSALYHVVSQINRYHATDALSYKQTSLIYPVDIVRGIYGVMENRFPDVEFAIRDMPSVVANKEALTAILEQLIQSLASLPPKTAARLEVGAQRDFATCGIYVSVVGVDYSSLVLEVPETRELLDWTLTSDLDLAVARRMIEMHSGSLYVEPEPPDGVRLFFTVGAPS
ncbi:PAS domain-containing protein [Burkholderia multivorans]|uniref:PAS domain-containing protein n=1 Tax=Burkholderia multivorans TaxID=87883 RepID=UPI001C23844C|nr:PAS domain-containing protein [Burkholderia multivorans]MBU9200159.1 PAS domain-containing protein [Burkholderia multivorans]MDN8078719.1 PAS domain-containing protein [Burkholderia multivorans]